MQDDSCDFLNEMNRLVSTRITNRIALPVVSRVELSKV